MIRGKVNVASSDQEAAAKALQMIGDITATAEVGKTYLGKVTRLADFGAFVEIIPGTDGLLHISEVAEHRIKDVKDELNEGDQVLVKVLAVDGNRIKLSRKAMLKEQRAKMAAEQGGDGPGEELAQGEHGAPGGVTFEGGYEGGDEPPEEGEPNFNREDAPGSAQCASGRGRSWRPRRSWPASARRRRRWWWPQSASWRRRRRRWTRWPWRPRRRRWSRPRVVKVDFRQPVEISPAVFLGSQLETSIPSFPIFRGSFSGKSSYSRAIVRTCLGQDQPRIRRNF